MRKFILLLLAVSLLLLLFIPLSVQAGETPPNWRSLRVEEQYEGHAWGDVDGGSIQDDDQDEYFAASINLQLPNYAEIVNFLNVTSMFSSKPIIIKLSLEDGKNSINQTFEIGGEAFTR